MTDNVKSIRTGRGTLGRGLSALIADTTGNAAVKAARENTAPNSLSLDVLQPGKFQPRSFFNEEELQELSESIKKNGVVQPVIVRKVADNRFEIIAGERRWRAARMAGHTHIPAIVMELSDKQALEVALVENIQRQNLTPLEVAEGYQRLIDEFKYTQEQLSEVLGKSRAQIANFIRLNSLPEEVKGFINNEKITVGHAKALLAVNDNDDLVDIANTIVKRNLNVRQTEKFVQKFNNKPKAKKDKGRDPDIVELEKALSKKLGLNLNIQNNGNAGKVIISYSSLSQLDNILRRLENI